MAESAVLCVCFCVVLFVTTFRSSSITACVQIDSMVQGVDIVFAEGLEYGLLTVGFYVMESTLNEQLKLAWSEHGCSCEDDLRSSPFLIRSECNVVLPLRWLFCLWAEKFPLRWYC